MNLSEAERNALVASMNQLSHSNQQLNNSLINQTLLIQALINLLKTKSTVTVVEGATQSSPFLVDQEIVDEFVKVRDQFIADTQKQKIITPEPGITVVEKKVEIVEAPTANPA